MKLKFAGRYAKPIERRFKERVSKPVKRRLELALAGSYRSVIHACGRICFIGITGSCGKTTTTELVAAILEQEGPVRKSSHENTLRCFTKTVLSLSPRHRFCISEISAHAPGALDAPLRLLRPQIGVVTNIAPDHYSSYRDLKLTAAEKVKLVEALPPEGVAVLNADDPHVREMRHRTRAKVLTYGLSADALVRGSNVSCAWPQRMSLDIGYGPEQIHVQTRLLGTHWAPAVLAALTTALAAGAPLERAVRVVEAFEPVPYRMSPHETPDGITFISDAWKSPLWTIRTCLDFLGAADVRRKIIVIGSISDTPKGFYHKYKAVIQQAPDTLDKIIFVGDHTDAALKARSGPDDDRIMAFPTVRRLEAFLSGYLRAGDLVLLKGTENVDHLHRLALSRLGGIACWREKCGYHRYCIDCRHLHRPAVPNDPEPLESTIDN